MPARKKKSDAASKMWKEKKGPTLSSNQLILSSKRPRKLKTWSNESMLLAIEAVRDETMGTNTSGGSKIMKRMVLNSVKS